MAVKAERGRSTSPGGCFIRRVGVSTLFPGVLLRNFRSLSLWARGTPALLPSPTPRLPLCNMNIELTQTEGSENTYPVPLLVSDLKLLHIPVWKSLLYLSKSIFSVLINPSGEMFIYGESSFSDNLHLRFS